MLAFSESSGYFSGLKSVGDDWEQPGSKLRTARESKGLTIADVVHRTRIPTRVVEALENDDYGSFPSPTYAKSFLSQYAEFVGVDSSLWMDFFEPVGFSGPDDVMSIVEGGSPRASLPQETGPVGIQRPNRTRGVRSTVAWVVLCGGIVYGIIHGAPRVESHFGGTKEAEVIPVEKPKFVSDTQPKTVPADEKQAVASQPPKGIPVPETTAPPRGRLVIEEPQ